MTSHPAGKQLTPEPEDRGASNRRTAKQPAATKSTGTLIGERYLLLDSLGQFGNSDLYLARDCAPSEGDSPESSDVVQLKALSDHLARDPAQLELFYLEGSAAAKLSHPNIIRTSEPEHAGGLHLCAIEHRPDLMSLRQRLNYLGWLTDEEAAEIIYQVADALAYAHERGVLHLRIRPESVYLDPDGIVKLIDFGLPASDGPLWAQEMRSRSCPVQYLSPEQASGARADHRSDLYSVGILFFEILTDRVPFDSQNADQVKERHLRQMPLPPHVFCSDVPPSLSDVVMQLLEKRPERRFQSATALQTALRELYDISPLMMAAHSSVMPLPVEPERETAAVELSSEEQPDTFLEVPIDLLELDSATEPLGCEDESREIVPHESTPTESAPREEQPRREEFEPPVITIIDPPASQPTKAASDVEPVEEARMVEIPLTQAPPPHPVSEPEEAKKSSGHSMRWYVVPLITALVIALCLVVLAFSRGSTSASSTAPADSEQQPAAIEEKDAAAAEPEVEEKLGSEDAAPESPAPATTEPSLQTPPSKPAITERQAKPVVRKRQGARRRARSSRRPRSIQVWPQYNPRYN